MAELTDIAQTVEALVSHVLDRHVPQIREELVSAVLRELPAATHAEASGGDGGAAGLLQGITAIHAGSNQKEILRALLDHTSRYASRIALFVMKSGRATGWQGRGFADNDAVKDFALDVYSGVPARALQTRTTFMGGSADVDANFISQFGAPHNDQVLLLPLVLKDKVAALVYADDGTEPGAPTDAAALEVLVSATGAWLEVASLRKQAPKENAFESAAPTERFESAPPVHSSQAFSDPFASHSPNHTAFAAAAPAFAHSMPEEITAEPAAEQAAVAVAEPPQPQFSAEDAEIHRKAQRFARLLMDEIKLYNQVKVTEGRAHHDLYDRLREDIEKSRGSFNKRYGNTAAASADYFNHELIRNLAEEDVSILGPNFRR